MTVNPRPVSAAGKDPLAPGVGPSQFPGAVDMPPSQEPHTPCGIEAMNSLIETVVLNNSRVRWLNAFRQLRRLDPMEGPSISDDEVESPVPTLGTFLDIQSALRPPPPAIPAPYTSTPPHTP